MTAVAIRRINVLRRLHTSCSLRRKQKLRLTKPTMSTVGINNQEYDYFMVLDFEATCDNEKDISPQRKQKLRLTKPTMSTVGINNQEYDYFMVLDFEATCDNEKDISPQEIIEFPVLKVNAKTFEVESQFHQYVQPVFNKELTRFCSDLTGIIQDMVDGQPHFEETLAKLDAWMTHEVFYKPDVKCIFVTCGDWDLKTMLPKQCSTSKLNSPPYLKNWINIKQVFEEVKGIKPRKKGDLIHMLEVLEVPHEGRYHSGIDDCKNIANILKAIAKTGYVFKETGRLH